MAALSRVSLVGEEQYVDESSLVLPRQTPDKLTDVKVTDRVLGVGSSAVVLELEYMGLKCAGKKIHEVFQEYDQEVPNTPIRRFEQECQLMSRLSHPNIVQFLGIYYDQSTLTPILVMEFLPINLTTWIDRYGIATNKISYSVLHDVALGLCYLHSQTPPIIHRDLSSNNVLLTANMTAKISDLATARILDDCDKTRWTMCPGTQAFMAPEALIANPKYDTGIDVFAYGVLIIHVLSAMWPEPQEAAVRAEADGTFVAVTEAERRDIFLEVIGRDHPLMDLIQICIANHPKIRPHATEIIRRLAMLYDPISAYQELFSMKTSVPQNEGSSAGQREILVSKSRHLHAETVTARHSMQPLGISYFGIDEIPGVEVCGKTSIFVTNVPQVFRWSQFGLKLHIHQGSLPSSEVQRCRVDIMVSLSGQYEFPEGSHCVSAVFWFRCTPVCRFNKAITVEIEHCAVSVGMLCFARAVCTQKDLPYKFNKLQSGQFSEHSSYGILQLNSFSAITIVNEGFNNKEYCARLFYMNPEIHFVITCNTRAHNTALQKDYQSKGAVSGPFQPIYFEKEEVILDIPMDGVTVEAWTITPLINPVVTKKQVDSYEKGKLPPCCQLHTKLSPGIMIVASVYHKVTLIGAKHPHNVFTIVLPIQGLPVLDTNQDPDGLRESTFTSIPISHKKCVGLEDSCNIPLVEDDLGSIMNEVISLKSRFYAVGRTLGLPPGELNAIRLTNQHDPEQALNDVLLLWIHQKYNVERFGLPTRQRLVQAIESPAGGNNPALAQSIAALHSTVQATKVVTPGPLISADDDLLVPILQDGIAVEQHKELLQKNFRQTLTTSYLSQVDSSLWPPVKIIDFMNINLGNMKRWEGTLATPKSVSKTITYGEVFSKLSQVKFILFTGQPGSGKTTFLTKLSHDWANGSLLQLELLFFIPLRQLNDYQEHSLATLLHVACPSLKQDEIAYLEGAIIKMEGMNMVFAFDGLDEYSTQSTNDIVLQLLNVYRSFLPRALIIATSRHDEPQLFVGMRIEIQGFTTDSEGIFQYMYRSFDNREKAQHVIQHLKQHPDIMSICCVPLHCAMLAFFYDEAAILPKTTTEYYKSFTLSFFSSVHKHRQNTCLISFGQLSSDEQEEFDVVRKLAYEASLARKEIFASSRISTERFNESDFCSVIRKYYFKEFSVNKSNVSLLLQFQHYLAAIYIARLPHSEQIDVIRKDVHCPYAVYKFLCGMAIFAQSSGVNLFDVIYSVVKSRSDYAQALIPCAYESRQQYPYDYLSKQWNGKFNFTDNVYFSSLTTLKCHEVATLLNSPSFQRVTFHYNFTAPEDIIKSIFDLVDNQALTVEISSFSSEGILTGITGSNIGSISLTLHGGDFSSDEHIEAFEMGFTPKMCYKVKDLSIYQTLHGDIARHLCSRLEYCVKLKKLCIHGTQVLHVEQFCNALHRFKHLQEIKIYCLKINEISLLINGLKNCSNLSVIDFGGLKLKTYGAHLLGRSFCNINNVQILYLDENDIEDDGLNALFQWLQCCSNLELLVLNSNRLTDRSVPLLVNLLQTKPRLQSNLRGLTTHNSFTEDGISKLKEVSYT